MRIASRESTHLRGAVPTLPQGTNSSRHQGERLQDAHATCTARCRPLPRHQRRSSSMPGEQALVHLRRPRPPRQATAAGFPPWHSPSHLLRRVRVVDGQFIFGDSGNIGQFIFGDSVSYRLPYLLKASEDPNHTLCSIMCSQCCVCYKEKRP